jgi:Holliday junction resolvasome RuvABC endonuclease subunit
MIHGTATVGSSSANVKQVTVTFAKPLTVIPVVVANTLQTDPASFNDAFAVSITSVSKIGFTANICRVDLIPNKGWGQELSLGYHATSAL